VIPPNPAACIVAKFIPVNPCIPNTSIIPQIWKHKHSTATFTSTICRRNSPSPTQHCSLVTSCKGFDQKNSMSKKILGPIRHRRARQRNIWHRSGEIPAMQKNAGMKDWPDPSHRARLSDATSALFLMKLAKLLLLQLWGSPLCCCC
jgi:hypothetical protein